MKPFHILLVEDNEGDIMLIKEALEDAKILVELSVLKDGKEAIDYLGNRSEDQCADLPDLLLLDINLPKRNGHEVLKYIKENENLKHIPVTMFTTSSSEMDVNLSYSNYANCYITKPVDLNSYLKVVATLVNFWINIVRLPAKNVII